MAQQAGRPFEYVARHDEDKQALAQRIAERDGISEGLVCVLRCLESCLSFAIRRDGRGAFRFRREERKCLHVYDYYLDREFGLMHVRVATWLPFGMTVCLNFDGKEVPRFLGRHTNCRFNGEVATSSLVGPEGLRVRHWLQENSFPTPAAERPSDSQ